MSKKVLGQDIKISIEEARKELLQYFNRPYLTTTYKPILLKSFLHSVLNRNHGFNNLDKHLFKTDYGLYISLEYIASCYIFVNWPLYKKYRLRQVSNKGVNLDVYNIFDKYNFYFRSKPTYSKEILEEIIKILKKDVLYRLRKNCYIYEFVADRGWIFDLPQKLKSTDFTPVKHDIKYLFLSKGVCNYLKENYLIINTALNYQMAKFIESCNHAPKICTKVGENPSRKTLNKDEIRNILELQERTCFYCGKSIEIDHSDSDHFIPWSFILETEVFNMVQACKDCNSSKSDILPAEKYFYKLQDRNISQSFLQRFKFKEAQALEKNRMLEIYFNDCSLYFEKDWKVEMV